MKKTIKKTQESAIPFYPKIAFHIVTDNPQFHTCLFFKYSQHKGEGEYRYPERYLYHHIEQLSSDVHTFSGRPVPPHFFTLQLGDRKQKKGVHILVYASE